MRFTFGPFLFDTAQGALSRDAAPVPLGGRSLLLLQALLEAKGSVVDKATLMEVAWPGLVVEESNLSVQIAALRKLLGRTPEGGDWIATVPRLGYRFVGAAPVAAEAAAAATPAADASPAEARQRPSIAVLPFSNQSGDASQDYFVDGITDDVIVALTRFRWFSVSSRSSSYAFKSRTVDAKAAARELGARYLVIGSVRRAADRVRISVELDEAATGRCLWADTYDFELVDVFGVQDQIARRVAASIEPELLKSETGLATRERTGTITGWDLVAQGCWNFHQVTRPTHVRARELFRKALEVDPNLVEARSWLARVDAGMLAWGWADDPAELQREGTQAALEAIAMDDQNGYSQYALAIISVFSGAFDRAIRAAERAVEVSPSFALGHLVLGLARLSAGDAEGAIPSLRQGIELNRHDPHNFAWNMHLATALLFAGKPDEALAPALVALKIRPQWRTAMEALAAICAATGQAAEASKWKEQAARFEAPAGDSLQPMWSNNPKWSRRMRELLASA